jgi:hypothetical protein
MKIIEEASTLIEENTKSKFPDWPFSDDISESPKRTQTSVS